MSGDLAPPRADTRGAKRVPVSGSVEAREDSVDVARRVRQIRPAHVPPVGQRQRMGPRPSAVSVHAMCECAHKSWLTRTPRTQVPFPHNFEKHLRAEESKLKRLPKPSLRRIIEVEVGSCVCLCVCARARANTLSSLRVGQTSENMLKLLGFVYDTHTHTHTHTHTR